MAIDEAIEVQKTISVPICRFEMRARITSNRPIQMMYTFENLMNNIFFGFFSF